MSTPERKPEALRVRSQRRFLEITNLPGPLSYFVSFVLVLSCTWMLHRLQKFVAEYDHLARGPSFIAFYFIAIAISTVFGGLNAGLFCVLLSLFCTAYFLMPPNGLAIQPTMTNYVTLAIVGIVGALVAIGMESLRNNTRLLVNNVDLLAAEQARADTESVLNKIGQTVRTASDPDQIQVIAVESLGQMLEVDGCYFIQLNRQKNEAVVRHYWRQDAQIQSRLQFSLSELSIELDSLMNGEGRPISFSDCTTDQFLGPVSNQLLESGVRAGILVPLLSDNSIDSVLAVIMFTTPRTWTDNEKHLVESVATQGRLAAESLRLQQKEHNIAVQLQAALQPQLALTIPGVNIASYYRPALDEANVGGDFFDAFNLGDGRFAFVVGDVSGKGLAAASQVAAIRNMLRCLLQTNQSIETAVTLLNDVLMQQELLPAFATLFAAVYNPATFALEYVSCGHEPAVLYHRQPLEEVELLRDTAPVVGVFVSSDLLDPRQRFTSRSLLLNPGDALLLFTDGVGDAGLSSHALLGVEGVTRIVAQFFRTESERANTRDYQVAAELLQHCMRQTEQFAQGYIRDDICLLAIVIQ